VGIFLAVATLLLLMNGLFFFILRNAARRLGKFSKMNMLYRANVYDELLENKEAELKALLREIEELRARAEAEEKAPGAEKRRAAPRGEAGVSDLLSLLGERPGGRDFAEGYRYLRRSAPADKAAGVEAAMERIRREAAPRVRNPAREILELFDLELRYRLCCLDDADAFRILRETLTDRAHGEILESFLRTSGGGVIDFFDRLRVRAFCEAPEIVIRTGDPNDRFVTAGPVGRPAVTEYDESVCEGVYVIADGRTYDFSVRNGDISG
jgi:hypothetical protein